MDAATLQKLYTFTYDLQFSPCGNFLTACDNFGFLSVFSLKTVLDPSSIVFGSNRSPLKKWKGSNDPLYTLCSTDKLLLAGGNDGVYAWKWKDVRKVPTSGDDNEVPIVFSFIPPTQSVGYSDVNSIAYDEANNFLYIASGSSVHVLNLETQQILNTYKGHKNYIHDVCIRPNSNQFLTGAEDGTIKLWDSTAPNKAVQTITCQKNDNKKNDNWVGCVSVDEAGEWMVFGGSCAPTLYKLGLTSPVAVFDVPSKVHTQAAIFTAGRIISGGSEDNVRHWARNGEPISSIPSSLDHVFSIKHNTINPQNEVLAVAGDSCEIDVFTHFGYKAFSLSSF